MPKATREALEREYAHAKSNLSKPGIDPAFAAMWSRKVKELERKLRMTAPGDPIAAPSALDAAEELDQSLVNGFMRRAVVGLHTASRGGSSRLPEDLLEALDQEKASYRGVKLREAAGVRIESAQMLSMEPSPSADDGWNGGTLLGFKAEVPVVAGEIVHVDPETGRVFMCTGPQSPLEASTVRQVESWCYKPFDFSLAIQGAASAPIPAASLQKALRSVQGGFDLRRSGPLTLANVWKSTWGILWGPPGTGKTHATTQQLITALLQFPSQRIIAAAPTNRAVDELTRRVAQGLKAQGSLIHDGLCRVFRGGKGAGEQLANLFPETLQDAGYRRLVAEIDQQDQLVAQLGAKGAPSTEIAQARKQSSDLRKALPDETFFAAKKGRATLIVVTIHRALRLVSELAGDSPFSRVVIDEAGMVPRAAAALIAPLAPHVFLAGDPKQIGPISRAPEGHGEHVNRWFRSSPMSHLQDTTRDVSKGDVLLLTEQYRMHPEICSVVSEFSYGKMLTTAPRVQERAAASLVPGFPQNRACWVVLDRCTTDPRKLAFRRAQIGRGYERDASARLLIEIAEQVLASNRSVLALTPYRAQANGLRRLGTERNFPIGRFIASTIHRQQGTEADVVLIDTVAAGRPFSPGELSMILNVAASRARDHLFLLCSTEEAGGPVTGLLASLLHPVSFRKGKFVAEHIDVSFPLKMERGITLSSELRARRQERPLFSEEQVELFRRRVDEGHHLVRGVAGSGKTFVLTHWLARFLEEHPKTRVLVSYANKALRPLLESLVSRALEARFGHANLQALERVTFTHVDLLRRQSALFDAVFVDEAQDMGPEHLRLLYEAARPMVRENGTTGLRPLYLFLDDSQNIRGNASLEALKTELPAALNFSGRVRVLREAFRSTREILDLAFNCVLDPHRLQGVREPGMREFMKTNELMTHDLLETPTKALDGLFHVAYTERSGVPPRVQSFGSESAEHGWLASEIRRLVEEEGLSAREILVVQLAKPSRVASALSRAGVPAAAFGGAGGQEAGAFPVENFEYVRVTTVSSCKGHEAPVVFFTGVDQLDDATWLQDGVLEHGDATPRGLERRLRAFFYVGATRAMYRQYISGQSQSRFVKAAAYYAGVLEGNEPSRS
ncbi:AAA family ATPase [Myxococcus sp. K15C18031901]|uniref:AAA domain-containing protein n=1 Tax=Myxococcus dinghuensis TaxID=2906761 RepID=UPI0020A7451E|nr:AAA domain-containing protein [Myxococcus dinghuensis]MCP3100947.1 AAA family ATPase [Myxococcus dinghuensis]